MNRNDAAQPSVFPPAEEAVLEARREEATCWEAVCPACREHGLQFRSVRTHNGQCVLATCVHCGDSFEC